MIDRTEVPRQASQVAPRAAVLEDSASAVANDVDAAVAALSRSVYAGLAFPSGDLVQAVRALWPTPERRQEAGFQQVLRGAWLEGAKGWHPGSWPVLEVGPGLVRLRRRDASARDRARARELAAGDRRYLERARELQLLREPIALSPLFDAVAPLDGAEAVARHRARVTEWSRRSQANLIRSILSLDLAAMLEEGRPPVMVTLTLPGRWLDVAPDGVAARRLFERFRARWSRRWGAPSWIWKREFQDRGAPHWHIWVVPPTDDLRAFKSWLSENWTAALRLEDAGERERSLRAGTNVSLAEGLRAADPKRLALYFLKESGPAGLKAYQNRVPDEWAGEVVGRFWGVAGIKKVVGTVELDPAVVDHVWRVLRRWREARAGTRVVEVSRVDSRTGVVRTRRVRRRVKVRASAGWVAVNDGPAAASQLARWLEVLGAHPQPPSL